jgi:Phosphotransferase enzyme family
MEKMKHGYTNDTAHNGSVVVKKYRGPRADQRRRRELLALECLTGLAPVPPLVSSGEGSITTGLVPGLHGQDLLRHGHIEPVLQACGRALRQLQQLGTGPLAAEYGHERHSDSSVIVHGDFGPNNLLIDPDSGAVAALVDWEWMHIGDPVDDLAWCEWILRTFHPDAVPYLDLFHAAFGGHVPDWSERKAAMLRQCQKFMEFTSEWKSDGPSADTRLRLFASTAEWEER